MIDRSNEQAALTEIRLAPRIAASVSKTPLIDFQLLGTFRGNRESGHSILPSSPKSRAALAYLAFHHDQTIPRRRIAGLLWDTVPDAQALHSLRQFLQDLNKALGRAAFAEVIEVKRNSVRLKAAMTRVDLSAVMRAGPDLPHLEVLDIERGALLEDCNGLSVSFDQWLITERERVSRRIQSIIQRALARVEQGCMPPQQRLDVCQQVLELEPTNEVASRTAMRALLELGNRSLALREYERLKNALRTMQDIQPSRETTALFQAVRAADSIRGTEQLNSPRSVTAAPISALPAAEFGTLIQLAVFPFNVRGPVADASLPLTMAQDTAAALGKFGWFGIIAPMSIRSTLSATGDWMATLRGTNADYAIDGVITAQNKRLLLSVKLWQMGQQLTPRWEAEFPLRSDDEGYFGNEAVGRIAGQIAALVRQLEGQKVRQAYSARDLVLRAIPLLQTMEHDLYQEAGRYLHEAFAQDPADAMAATWLAYWHLFLAGQGWSSNPRQSQYEAERLCVLALKRDPGNAEANAVYGHVLAFVRQDFEQAIHHFDRALQLNPYLAIAWALSAATYAYTGRADEALVRMNRYRDLSLLDPHLRLFESISTVAHLFRGDLNSAAESGRRAITWNPAFTNAYKPLIAALGHLGQGDDAADYLARLLAIEPDFSIAKFARFYPFGFTQDRDHYVAGLRLAGVPEL